LQRLRAASPQAKVDAQVVLTPGNCDLTRIARELKAMGFRRTRFLYRSDGDCADGAPPDGGRASWTEPDIRALMRAREKFYPHFLQSALQGRPEADMGFAGLVAAQPDGPGGLCVCGSGEVYIDCRGDIYACPNLYGQAVPAAQALGNCAESDARAPLPAAPVARTPDPACARCWAFEHCRGGCLVQCQRCALSPAGRRAPFQELWCDLLRAQFARAAITHRLLERYHPEALGRIRPLFNGDAV
jgi:radical SAM protein with 4Fe4S-binding SPASM domain